MNMETVPLKSGPDLTLQYGIGRSRNDVLWQITDIACSFLASQLEARLTLGRHPIATHTITNRAKFCVLLYPHLCRLSRCLSRLFIDVTVLKHTHIHRFRINSYVCCISLSSSSVEADMLSSHKLDMHKWRFDQGSVPPLLRSDMY